MRFWRLLTSPHLIVCGIQIVVAVLATIGILGVARSTMVEIGLGAVLMLVDSLAPAAAHAAITRRQAQRQALSAVKRAELRWRTQQGRNDP